MSEYKPYTGIGSRSTPEDVLAEMAMAAHHLYKRRYTLRSGKAAGADTAFQQGVQSVPRTIRSIDQSAAEIFLPWKNSCSNPHLYNCWDITDIPWERCFDIASKVHPAWDRCSSAVKKLHARNVCQILGKTLDSPSLFVLFWAEERNGVVRGGTATAVNLAREHNIPTINIYTSPAWKNQVKELLKETKT